MIPPLAILPQFFDHMTLPTPYSGYLTEDKLEDVVENVVAAGSIWQQLEALGVVHWSLLLIDL